MAKKKWLWWGLLAVGVVLILFSVFPSLKSWIAGKYFALTASRQTMPDLPLVSVLDPASGVGQDESSVGESTVETPDSTSVDEPAMGVVAENLEIPWEIAFLPDGSLLVAERPGRIVRILASEQKTIPVEGVVHRGEGGAAWLSARPQLCLKPTAVCV